MADTGIDPDRAKEFYDARYLEGYMEGWPAWKKMRVADMIRDLPLPPAGKALDFGCGSGVFTEVIKDTLPGWTVYGAELSDVALQQARLRTSRCQFLEPASVSAAGPFDFIFTHHVLEHVTSLSSVFEDMSRLLSPHGSMLHILPCGNAGSLEQRICQWRRDGIQGNAGGRFFFEDAGHLRRLTSEQFVDELRPFGFRLSHAWFANHRWGAVDWITDLDLSFVASLSNPLRARTTQGGLALAWWALVLSAARILKRGATRLGPAGRRLSDGVRRRADDEWTARRDDPSGSEMYLFFERNRGS